MSTGGGVRPARNLVNAGVAIFPVDGCNNKNEDVSKRASDRPACPKFVPLDLLSCYIVWSLYGVNNPPFPQVAYYAESLI